MAEKDAYIKMTNGEIGHDEGNEFMGIHTNINTRKRYSILFYEWLTIISANAHRCIHEQR